MTRNRKKLKTRTKISVRKAASSFPASQRRFKLDLERLPVALAAAEQEDADQHDHDDADPDHEIQQPVRAAVVLRRRERAGLAGPRRPQARPRPVGDLLAVEVAVRLRARELHAAEAV